MFFPASDISLEPNQYNLFRIKLRDNNLYATINYQPFSPIANIILAPLLGDDLDMNANDSAPVLRNTQLFYFNRINNTTSYGILYNLAHTIKYGGPCIIDGDNSLACRLNFSQVTDTFWFDVTIPSYPIPQTRDITSASFLTTNPLYPGIVTYLNGNLNVPISLQINQTALTIGINLGTVAQWEIHTYPFDLFPLQTTVLTPYENFNKCQFRMDLTALHSNPAWDVSYIGQQASGGRITNPIVIFDTFATISNFPNALPYNMSFDFDVFANLTSTSTTSSQDPTTFLWKLYPSNNQGIMRNTITTTTNADTASFVDTGFLNSGALTNQQVDVNTTPIYLFDDETVQRLSSQVNFSMTNNQVPSGYTLTDFEIQRSIDPNALFNAIPTQYVGLTNTTTTILDLYGIPFPKFTQVSTISGYADQATAIQNPFFQWQVVEMSPLTPQIWSATFNDDIYNNPNAFPTFNDLATTTNNYFNISIQNVGSSKVVGLGPFLLSQTYVSNDNLSTISISSIVDTDTTSLILPDASIIFAGNINLGSNTSAGSVASTLTDTNTDTSPPNPLANNYISRDFNVTDIANFYNQWTLSPAFPSTFLQDYFNYRYQIPQDCCVSVNVNALRLCNEYLSLVPHGTICDSLVNNLCQNSIQTITYAGTNPTDFCVCIKSLQTPVLGVTNANLNFCFNQLCFTDANAYKLQSMVGLAVCPTAVCQAAVVASQSPVYFGGIVTSSCAAGFNLITGQSTTPVVPPTIPSIIISTMGSVKNFVTSSISSPVFILPDITAETLFISMIVISSLVLLLGFYITFNYVRKRQQKQKEEKQNNSK